jgi:PAS domain-containing protein
MSGRGATWHVNALVPITRHGRREDVYWTYSYSPIDDDTAPNGIGGVLVVCTETTQQVLASRRIATERDRLAQLFEQAPTFMAMLRGPEHRIELANPSYMQLIGHRPLLGRTLAEALPDAVAQGYLVLLDDVYRSGKAYSATSAKFEIQALPGGPTVERFVDFVYQPIKDQLGEVTGIFVVGADVTDRARADAALRESEFRLRETAEKLRAADAAKDEFLATLAHELRNPLAPMRNAVELLGLAPQNAEVISTVPRHHGAADCANGTPDRRPSRPFTRESRPGGTAALAGATCEDHDRGSRDKPSLHRGFRAHARGRRAGK